ncbi:MAG: AAA family ATPase, partial [Anaerolineae bacterium]|nr:AAA family ATPase [Anaerolineae bacterium]
PTGARSENHQDANDRSQVIGAIKGLQGTQLSVALDKRVAAQIAEGNAVLPKKGRLAYKALGELAQVRRLRWGLESLLRGRSKNPRLGDFLFDANEAGLPDPQTALQLSHEELLQPHLNEGQLRAVEGALNAPDLYLIQGPPGTGKTTVIAEICYQVAMRGGRTMVASQANLAVDHAMSRLVHHPSIRALRRGRAERVEEEGKPYLEDYVIGTWLDKVSKECRGDLDARQSRLDELQQLVHLRAEVEAFDAARARYGSESRPLKASVRQAKRAHQTATLSLSSAQALRTEMHETGQFLTGLRTLSETADDASLELLARPAHSAEAWVRIWEPAVYEGLQTLQALEQAIETWTVPDHVPACAHAGTPDDGVRVEQTPDPGHDALAGRIFTSYVRRGWSATEMASRIAARAADAEPKIEALSELCEAWYSLVAREQPLLDGQRARRMAPSNRRARMVEMQTAIARHEATIEDLQTLARGIGRVHREILTWLLRRATAEGPVSEVPEGFQSGVRREIWEAAGRGQRLPSLRGVAASARQ